jgi:hypothetical protein
LLGVHNFANLFAKNKMHNGGAYLALTFRPLNKRESEKERGSGREKGKRNKGRRSGELGCPVNVR